MPSVPTPENRPLNSRMLCGVSILLFVSVVINYIDRGNLSVAAPLVKTELGLSVEQLGTLLSAVFWTYATFQLVSGWLVDRFNENWIMAGGFFLWSAATAATGLIGGFASLLVLRLILGMAESVAYPTYSKILTLHFNENQRGLANTLIDIGTKCGPAMGTLAGGILMARFGWRPFFIVLGLGSLAWLPFWVKWMPRRPAMATQRAGERPGFREILRHPSAWATCVGLFCGNYFWYFLLTWLPFYLVRERHFSMQTMAVVGTLPYLFTAGATAVAGGMSYRAIARGVSTTRVRKTCTSAGLALATVIVAVPAVTDTRAAMALLMLASIGYGVYCSSHWAIMQTLAGPLAAGRWTGLQNFTGNLSGVVAPWLTGFVVQHTGHFFWAFVVTAAIALSGSAIYLFGIGPVEQATWRCQTAVVEG